MFMFNSNPQLSYFATVSEQWSLCGTHISMTSQKTKQKNPCIYIYLYMLQLSTSCKCQLFSHLHSVVWPGKCIKWGGQFRKLLSWPCVRDCLSHRAMTVTVHRHSLEPIVSHLYLWEWCKPLSQVTAVLHTQFTLIFLGQNVHTLEQGWAITRGLH